MSTRTTHAATVRADRHVNSTLTSGLALACHYAAARPDCQALARQAGHPWSTVAALLGVTRQAAQQRFARGTTPGNFHDHLT